MGAAESSRSNNSEPDPWWSPQTFQQHSQSNVLQQEEGAAHSSENEDSRTSTAGEEKWLKQIQDLGKIIEDLANKNVELIDSNKELKLKCEGQEKLLEERREQGEGAEETLNTIICLQEKSAKDKEIIDNLNHQLQTSTESSTAEVEKYHENLNFMHTKLKEYEQVVDKLEKDVAVQNTFIQSLQGSLKCNDDQKKVAEQSVLEIRETLETLQKDHTECQEENKILRDQLESERSFRRKVLEENQKLMEELKQLKQRERSQAHKRTSENSDADFSDADLTAEMELQPPTSDSGRSEEQRTLSPRVAAELEVFQRQLKVKREARHKALSAISVEMERLRRELNSEREARKTATKELEYMKNMADGHQVFEEVNHLKLRLSSEREEKDKIYKEMMKIQKQGNEEIESILKQLEKEKTKTEHVMGENKFMKEQLEESDQQLQLRSEENSQLQNKLDSDREKYQQQILALKDVVAISKQMLTVRENQVTHLKQTLRDIEATVAEKRNCALTADLRAEYETQMENIKTLKALYEERTQIMNVEKEKLLEERGELKRSIEDEKRRIVDLEIELQEKEAVIAERNETVSSLQDQLSEALDQSRDLSHELTLINNMFTQILGSSDMDLDQLMKLLQENHDLITEITTKGECSETAASLPKMLLDIVRHMGETDSGTEEKAQGSLDENSPVEMNAATDQATNDNQGRVAAQVMNVGGSGSSLALEDISSNLPKVWRVLLELISHHVPSSSDEIPPEESKTSCYKSIDTPYGPKNVISVSKTFLRLRDLILQKRSLQKEVTRLKQLNVHLETKLNDQERRLSLVSSELRKTWNVVDHMRVQHQQLHTHEKVLRYELQQKRKLLTELKEELEYCREKWEEARYKNSQSEVEWQKLRHEFAMRKNKAHNNSGESGFSDEREEESSDNEVNKLQGKIHQDQLEGVRQSSLHQAVSSQNAPQTDELEAGTSASSSLPDLVSATPDISSPHSEVTVSEPGIPVTGGVSEDSIPTLQNIVAESLYLEPATNDTATPENTVLEDDCPTVSLITSLKQQLSCFSKNLEIITAGFDTNDHHRALQSIFALPAIQIPEDLNPTTENSSTSCLKMHSGTDSEYSSTHKGAQCTEECHSEVRAEERSFSPSSEEEEEIMKLQTQERLCQDSAESSSCSIPESPDVTSQENDPLFLLPADDLEEENADCKTSTPVQGAQQESRSERLQRLERQCKELFNKVTQKSDEGATASCSTEQEKQTASQESTSGSTRSLEDMLDARAARLKRLEEQSQQLFKKVKRTTHRSAAISNRLEELHEQYGSEDASTDESITRSSSHSPLPSRIPVPPPLPDQLPAAKLPTTYCSQENAVSLPLPSSSTSHIPTPSPPENLLDPQVATSSRSEEDSCQLRLDARAARLKRLEEQSQQLFTKVKRTTHRSEELSSRLEELHEQYSGDPAPINTTNSSQASCSASVPHIPDPPPLPSSLVNSTPSSGSSQEGQNEHPSCSSTSIDIPTPPPLPSTLPPSRLPTEIDELRTRTQDAEEADTTNEENKPR